MPYRTRYTIGEKISGWQIEKLLGTGGNGVSGGEETGEIGRIGNRVLAPDDYGMVGDGNSRNVAVRSGQAARW